MNIKAEFFNIAPVSLTSDFPLKKLVDGFTNWKRSENALRELRKKVTFAIFAETDNLNQVTKMVDELFTLLEKADRI